MTALQAGLEGMPLVLIQGPPGTGKTRTILNLLSVVMHSAAKGSLELIPRAVPSTADGATSAAAASTRSGGGRGRGRSGGRPAEDASTIEQQRLHQWRLQSPWMFGLYTARELVGPDPDIGVQQQQQHVLALRPAISRCTAGVCRLRHAGFCWLLSLHLFPLFPSLLCIGLHTDHRKISANCFGLTAQCQPVRLGVASGPRARVLVCAPSNAALDELVLRVLQHGLLDGQVSGHI